MARREVDLYPSYGAFIDEIEQNGISAQLLSKIINKHRYNSAYNKKLYKRYMGIDGGVPIYERKPRFKDNNPINNKINNDFFGEIVNFETGYLVGNPITYGYSSTEEAENVTGGETGVEVATKALTDFTTRNNMHGVDVETTRLASIYGYAGRLFYIDLEGNERVMPVHGYETIILSKTDITEPQYAIRYYPVWDINDVKTWVVEFYDNTNIHTYKGFLSQLELDSVKPHMFDLCPLQGIPRNMELMGAAEKVIDLIDAYNKLLSDNVNEAEAFAHAYLIFEGLRVDEKIVKEGQVTGTFNFPAVGTQQGKAYYLTKDINDNFTEHNLERIHENILNLSDTPNLKDATFGTASGEALKFKIHGLETKCKVFRTKIDDAAKYMWRVLASAWKKKAIQFDPLQVTMDYNPNFPSSLASEAELAVQLKNIGLPDEIVYGVLSCVDDVDYVLELKEQEMEKTASLNENTPDDNDMEEYGVNEKNMYKVTSVLGQLKRGQITKTVAIRILTSLGFTDENAETIVTENMDEKETKAKKEAGGTK